MVIRGGSSGWEEIKCHSYLQEGQRGGSRELQDGQPHLNPWEGGGVNNLGNYFQTY